MNLAGKFSNFARALEFKNADNAPNFSGKLSIPGFGPSRPYFCRYAPLPHPFSYVVLYENRVGAKKNWGKNPFRYVNRPSKLAIFRV